MTSLQDYTFEWIAPLHIPLVNKFYQAHAIRGKAGRHDRCAVLRTPDSTIVAVAVIKAKQRYALLTHVGVREDLRRQGLASLLMSQMQTEFNSQTYCFPFCYLESLYLTQGFVSIEEAKASLDVRNQYHIYQQQGRDILLMRYQLTDGTIDTADLNIEH